MFTIYDLKSTNHFFDMDLSGKSNFFRQDHRKCISIHLTRYVLCQIKYSRFSKLILNINLKTRLFCRKLIQQCKSECFKTKIITYKREIASLKQPIKVLIRYYAISVKYYLPVSVLQNDDKTNINFGNYFYIQSQSCDNCLSQ